MLSGIGWMCLDDSSHSLKMIMCIMYLVAVLSAFFSAVVAGSADTYNNRYYDLTSKGPTDNYWLIHYLDKLPKKRVILHGNAESEEEEGFAPSKQFAINLFVIPLRLRDCGDLSLKFLLQIHLFSSISAKVDPV